MGLLDNFPHKSDDKPSIKKSVEWRQFEKICERLIFRDLDESIWRIYPQRKKTYKDGVTKIMDFHIAERRQGGRGIVIDCKHFPIAWLNKHEIDSVLEYKRRSRASMAILMISKSSNYDNNFIRQAEKRGVRVFIVDPSRNIKGRRFFKRFFKKRNKLEQLMS